MLSFACLDFTSSDDCYISTTRHAKRGTKVRGINQIIPIYPSRSEYARKCPKTVSKTSQQTCCLRELRFLDEIKKVCARFWHDFYQKDQKLEKFRHFRKNFSWIDFRNLILRKMSENRLRITACTCMYFYVRILHWTYTSCLMIFFVTDMFVINHIRVWYSEIGIA